MKRTLHKSWFWDAYAAIYDMLPRCFEPYEIQLRRVLELVEAHRKPATTTRVLDAGCGTGNYTQALQARGCAVTGLDNSASMLSRAWQKIVFPAWRVCLHNADLAERLSFPDETFDCVISINALYMLEHPRRVLAEFARVLRPRGTLILSHPCRMPSLLEITADHARRFGLLSVLRPFYILAALGFFNWIIAQNFRRRSYCRWSGWELREAIAASGFRTKTIECAYTCDSNLLVSAVKERMP